MYKVRSNTGRNLIVATCQDLGVFWLLGLGSIPVAKHCRTVNLQWQGILVLWEVTYTATYFFNRRYMFDPCVTVFSWHTWNRACDILNNDMLGNYDQAYVIPVDTKWIMFPGGRVSTTHALVLWPVLEKTRVQLLSQHTICTLKRR